jgi:transposase
MDLSWIAVERMMKLQEAICRALAGTLSWLQPADILGMEPRSLRRWRARYEAGGQMALYDRRHGPSPRKAPAPEVERVLRLYLERYLGWNVRHFHRFARREHGVTLSYSFVRFALQEAGLVRKGRARGRHRRRREPRACFGELLHLDGSDHVWLTLRPDERQPLIAVIDDATKRLLYAPCKRSSETPPSHHLNLPLPTEEKRMESEGRSVGSPSGVQSPTERMLKEDVVREMLARLERGEGIEEWSLTIADQRIHGTTHEQPAASLARRSRRSAAGRRIGTSRPDSGASRPMPWSPSWPAGTPSPYSTSGPLVTVAETATHYEISAGPTVIARHLKRPRFSVTMEPAHYAGLLRVAGAAARPPPSGSCLSPLRRGREPRSHRLRRSRRDGRWSITTPQLDRLRAACHRLRLYQIEAELGTVLEQAAKHDVSYADFLDDVLCREVGAKTQKHLAMRIDMARFPFQKTLEAARRRAAVAVANQHHGLRSLTAADRTGRSRLALIREDVREWRRPDGPTTQDPKSAPGLPSTGIAKPDRSRVKIKRTFNCQQHRPYRAAAVSEARSRAERCRKGNLRHMYWMGYRRGVCLAAERS